uniref:ATPase subunit 6 n=1 Tax=Neobenedenia melleni TaxID=280695 RepID=A0A096VGV5_9PLAT|nr:ATPase subunit 6 [Neobenedenia melleni]
MLSINNFNFLSNNVIELLVPYLSSTYNRLMFILFIYFLLLRMPYIYSSIAFMGVIICVISPLFLSIFLSRICTGLNEFFSSLLPPGTPLGIAPFVCLAETISYIVRPIVLMIRPFLNITIGSIGGASLASITMSLTGIYLFLCLLFFYEIFVAVVHWFIISKILSFSVDH